MKHLFSYFTLSVSALLSAAPAYCSHLNEEAKEESNISILTRERGVARENIDSEIEALKERVKKIASETSELERGIEEAEEMVNSSEQGACNPQLVDLIQHLRGVKNKTAEVAKDLQQDINHLKNVHATLEGAVTPHNSPDSNRREFFEDYKETPTEEAARKASLAVENEDPGFKPESRYDSQGD